MSPEEHDLRVDYVEFPATDIEGTKRFYSAVFGWEFTDYGSDYIGFGDERVAGGFTTSTPVAPPGVLVVLYAIDLEAVLEKVVSAGGSISQTPYDFPGGRRFHFQDPNGNELAVWSDR